MKKTIFIIFVVLFLIAISIAEQIVVSNYLFDIEQKAQHLIEITKDKTNIQTEEIYNLVEDLEQTWKAHEEILCIVANHKDMRDLCTEIQRLRGNIEVNQYEDFTAGIKVIYHLAQDYHYLMGLSLQNIF